MIIGAAITGLWWLSGRNDKVRSILTYVIPEKFLPDTEVSGYTGVSTIGDDLEEDAPEIDLDDSTANT